MVVVAAVVGVAAEIDTVAAVVAVAAEVDTVAAAVGVAASPVAHWAVVVFDGMSMVVRWVGCPVVVRRRRKSFPRNCRNCCRMLHCPRFDSRSFCKVSLMSLSNHKSV